MCGASENSASKAWTASIEGCMAHMSSEDLAQTEPVALDGNSGSLHHHSHWAQELVNLVKCSEVIRKIHLEFEVEIACFGENSSVRD
jgi:hypothetical protein